MPTGMEVGLSSGDIVLDGDPALPSQKSGTATKMPLGTEVGLRPGDIVLDGDPPVPRKGDSIPAHLLAHVYCGQTVAHFSNC